MMEECTEIIIGGSRLKMFFSLSAMAKLVKKYGSLEGINEAIFSKSGNDAEILNAFKELTEVAAVLVNAARDVAAVDASDVTAEWIEKHITYSSALKLRDAVTETILRGLSGDLPDDEETDEELAVLNAKKNEITVKTEQTL